MEIEVTSKKVFLVLRNEIAPSEQRIEIIPRLKSVLQHWTSGTRVSPLWAIKEFAVCKTTRCMFNGPHILLFIGPVSSIRALSNFKKASRPGNCNAWVGVGAFNLVVRFDANEEGTEASRLLIFWANENKVPYERWQVEDGCIKQIEAKPLISHQQNNTLKNIEAFSPKKGLDPSLTLHANEFYVLMVSAMARSKNFPTKISENLSIIFSEMEEDIEGSKQADSQTITNVRASLVLMNSALSRFSSQTFSGISPITSTSCHLATHSLLGTGTANLALDCLVGTIVASLGSALLPERVIALKSLESNFKTYDELSSHKNFINDDCLGKITLENKKDNSIIPLLTYFSGREGYSSHLQTLSAPPSSIAYADSYSVNILTVTHELSHIVVEGILAYLYPEPNDKIAIEKIADILSKVKGIETKFDEAQRLLMEAFIVIEQDSMREKIYAHNIDADLVSYLIKKWRKSVKEIIVHTFDYLYFFQNDPKSYVYSIWNTWCSIPGIGDRIEEYVLRTLCAISSGQLHNTPEQRYEETRKILIEVLEELSGDQTITTDYALTAKKYLLENWNDIKDSWNSRIDLVRLVSGYFYSKTITADLLSDSLIGSGKTGYSKKRGIFDEITIENPLRFTRAYLQKNLCERDSLWLLHNVAFCCDEKASKE